MGCDIHCYIEYKSADSDSWQTFGRRINPGRNYSLFARLAGVRSYGDVEHIPPRGRLENMAYAADADARVYISETESEGHVKPDSAARWIASGSSRYIDNDKGEHVWVTNPDHHSHTWLTPNEWATAIEGTREPEYLAMLAALRSFESQGLIARVVFWFDN